MFLQDFNSKRYALVILLSLLSNSVLSTNAAAAPPPPPPPIEGLNNFKSPLNQSGHNPKGDQSQHNNKSRTTSNTNTPPPPPLEVPTPTREFGKKYAKLINPDAGQQNLKIEFPKKITSLVRDELTLNNLTADADKILALFSKKDGVILSEAKEKYKELIQDPYIAQFINTKNQKTGDFLDNKLFEESQEDATLRLLSLELLDEQKKRGILSKQGDILQQLKFIKEHSKTLDEYGKTTSAAISKKLPKELPGILSKQGDILGQLKFINENSEILGEYGKTTSADVSKKLTTELPEILNKQGNELEQLKFINEHSKILGDNSKAILKDILKKLSKKLDQISSKQLVGFILDENHINTNLREVPFSKKEVREQVDNLNNKILEKIFLKDDGEITEQDLNKILRKYKEADLIKNLTKAIVYIDGNTNNEALNKTLEKGLENTTPEQQGLILNVLTHNTRIRKVLINKIEIEQKQLENKKLKKSTEGDPLVEALKKVLAQRKSTNQETIEEQLARRKQETTESPNVWDRLKNMNNLGNQNNDTNAQNDNEQKWKETNQSTQDENNNGVDEIKKANQELVKAVNAAIEKSKELERRLRSGTITIGGEADGYLAEAQNQLTLAEKNKEAIAGDLLEAFKIIPEKEQSKIKDNDWQNYVSSEEITRLNTLDKEMDVLNSKKNDSRKFISKTDADKFKATQQEHQTLSAELKKVGITKQKEQLVKDYLDGMVTNAKKAVGKIETTLECFKKKEEGKKHTPVISRRIQEAQEQLKKAEKQLETIKLQHQIIKQRGNKENSSDDDSDGDWDGESDKKATTRKEKLENKRKQELEDAKEAVKQAQKNLEDVKAEEAKRKQQEEQNRQEQERKRQEEQNHQEQERKRQEEQNHQEQERKRQEEQNRQEQERNRQEEQNRQEQERKRQEEQNRQEQERKRQEEQNRQEQERKHQEEQNHQEQERKHQEEQNHQEQERNRQEEQNRQEQERKQQEEQNRQEQERQQQEEQNHQEQERQRQEEQNHQEQERKQQEEQNHQEQERKHQKEQNHQEQERKQQEEQNHQEQERNRQEEQNRQEQERKQQEEQNRQEQERKRQEEQNHQEQERKQQEEQNHQEQERKQQEEQNHQEQERQQQEEAKRKQEEEETKYLEDIALMFKTAEEEAKKQEVTEAEARNQEEETESENQKRDLDEGYKTDDEELEESNNTNKEEFKKDIALESADEAIDMLLETEETVEQDEAVLKEQFSKDTNNKVAVLDGVNRMASTLHKHIHPSILTNRLNIGAVGAGDEEITINRGVWISGLYGINKQRAWKNIPKYQGRTAGVTIGADAEFVNSHDIIGIAYSRLESHVKYNKKLGKTAINGHLLSIYGLKELIKGFSLQAITSYGHNYIKNKSTSINNIIGKYKNNNLSFETLLNYKYQTKYDLHFIPSIGFKYNYSRASNYKEYEVDIENLMIQKKSNQSFESSLGGKIVFKPIATISNIVLTPSLHGNVEHHFNNKNTKVNAKATFKGQILEETIILPKQPKLGYNIGSNILMSRKNINVLLEYNYYTHKKYQSHQGLVKLKVNL